jgi:hypothetical protein
MGEIKGQIPENNCPIDANSEQIGKRMQYGHLRVVNKESLLSKKSYFF